MGASIHIDAEIGEIAETILLPGDPLRAQFIAREFLENAHLFNEVRGMLGYTGVYNGKKVSVMGTGMGMPSMAIYAHELITVFGCKNLIRIGSAGSYQKDVHTRDLVLAVASSTDSRFEYTFDLPGHFSPCADFGLMMAARSSALQEQIHLKAGNVASVDVFYDDSEDVWKKWAKMGVLAVEMESAALYMNAARYGAKALTLLTISDNFVTGEKLSPQDRETSFTDMIKVALGMLKYL